MKADASFLRAAAASLPEARPGRSCPASYRYPPRSLDREPDIETETLYVAGGLYGNVEALDALLELVAAEPGAALAFNGDFHWFDVEARDFESVGREVLAHFALRGNVETELAGETSDAGCGCAYPAEVGDAEVSRSNAILERLRDTARQFPELRARQGALPMSLVARVGDARVAIVHGDASSLAGWGFAHDQLDDPRHARWLDSVFRDARADIFASSHTCLAACRVFPRGVVINNGSAGMPNFEATGYGLVTRLSVRPAPCETLYGARVAGAFADAVPLRFDERRWMRRFLAAWPEGSDAHASYYNRIAHGPRHAPERAAPLAA